MLREVSSDIIVPEPSEDLIINEPWSIEFYADGLMDELFASLDEILEGSQFRHRQPLRQAVAAANDWSYASGQPTLEYDHVQTVEVPQIVLPNTVKRPAQHVTAIRNQSVNTVVVEQAQVTAIGKVTPTAKLSLSKLLIVGTTLGMAIAGVIYLVQSGVLVLLTSQLNQTNIDNSVAQSSEKPDVQAELVNYMIGALAVIDERDRTSSSPVSSRLANRVIPSTTSVGLSNQQAIGNLPTPLTANNTTPTPSRANNVVERIYIPVFQPPTPMRSALPSIPGIAPALPPVANQPSVVNNTLNQVQSASKPSSVNMIAAAVRPDMKPVAVRNAPVKVQQSPSALPNLPVIPFGANIPRQSTNRETVPVASLTVASSTPVPTHTLEGLLELGNKSVALFQVNGVSRRISIGESIGSSGWTLVEVSNGEAIVRRNGEVRSIFTGQKL